MKFDGTSWRLAALVAAVSIGLSGCVGGGGKANVAEEISGIASDGKALANATITILDAAKTEATVTTDANGKYTFRPGSQIYPMMMSVVSGDKTLYSVITSPDQHVNINPGTTAIAAYALNTTQIGSVYYTGAFKKLTVDHLAQAEQVYLQTMRGDSELAQQLFDESPRTKQFQPESLSQRGDAYDQYLAFVEVALKPQDGRMVILNRLPERLGKPVSVVHSGTSDDLLTGGLGDAGLAASAPGYPSGSLNFSAVQLRTNAIYNQYHALTDLTAAGGYGALYGKAVKVPGTEYLAYTDDGTGNQNVSVMVQIPDSFNKDSPCILVVPTPATHGIYGASPTAEWGLKRGCAIAVTDKGAGNGAEIIDTAESYEIDGRQAISSTTSNSLQFRTLLAGDERAKFGKTTQGRFAFKLAHSQQNPEKNWGRNVLDATKLAFYLLNEKYGTAADIGERKIRVIKPEQTSVIVAGEGEGGGAALAAMEQDGIRLLDGVIASQPQAQLAGDRSFNITQGSGSVAASGKPLLDYLTYANLYQPCAGLASSSAPGAALLDVAAANNRCSSLRQKGLLAADTLSGQVAESLQKLRAYGWQPEADELHGASYMLETPGAAMAYANAYGKFSVAGKLCDLSYGVIDANGVPVPRVSPSVRLPLFADGNGMPPFGAISLIYDKAANSLPDADMDGKYNYGIGWKKAISPSTGKADYAFDAAYCLRRLTVGSDPVTGAALSSDEQKLADAIKAGMGEVGLSAALQGRPAIVLHGRSDSVFPVNHSSRPYVARSLAVQGASNKLRYYEVLNAQHFDAALGDAILGGFDTRYVPMRHYLLQSLDLMYNHLTLNKPLPDSQVIRTVPRGGVSGSAPAITLTNAPLIPTTPAAANLIQYNNSTLSIPN